ncbi:MAG: DUF1761 domain-containing protein [Alsobacter sp.]
MNSITPVLPILAAAAAGWVFGAVWYGVLGPQWMEALGKRREDMVGPSGRPSPTPFILSFLAEILMAGVLYGLMPHFGGPGLLPGIAAAVTVWFGFVVTTQLVNNAYALRSLRLTVIDAGHWLGVLLVQGVVLGLLG